MTGGTVISGANGQLGSVLARLLPQAAAWTEQDCDLAQPAAVLAKLRAAAPATVINCGALTDVDACERNPALTMRVNALGVQPLAQWQRESGCRVVQLSSDYLFDGRQRRPYTEDDPPCPVNVYGVSKWLSERWLTGGPSLIVRTSTLLGPGAASFVAKVRAWAAGRDQVRVVADVVAAPTVVDDLAQALLQLLAAGVTGTVNLTNAGACSRAELARCIIAAGGSATQVVEARQADFAVPARRPEYSELALERAKKLGINMRPWREALAELLAQPERRGKANHD